MIRLILVRHGETDWNLEGRYQGQSDVPMNDRGRRQSADLVPDLKAYQPSIIYSSDLKRAGETAGILSQELGVPVIFDPRLREVHLGSWEGMLFPEIQARYSELLVLRRQNPDSVGAPGGETLTQVRMRVLAAIEEIKSRHQNECVAVISHGLPLAILQAWHHGRSISEVWDLVPRNCQLIELAID